MKRYSFDPHQVQEMLNPHLDDLKKVFEEGFEIYKNAEENLRRQKLTVLLESSTKSHLAWDIFKNVALHIFGDEKAVLFPEWYKSNFGLWYEDKLFLRIKRVDNNDRWSNIKTKNQRRFEGDPQLDLGGTVVKKDPQILIVGYVPDATMTTITDVRIISNLRAESKHQWAFGLNDPMQLPTLISTEQLGENQPLIDYTGERLVKPKKKSS